MIEEIIKNKNIFLELLKGMSFVWIFSSPFVYGDELVSKNLFGSPGIIDMPTAGSFKDGEISFTSSKFGPNLRNTIGFQALPRVYTAFRYSGIGDKPTGWKDKSGYSLWDRSLDFLG